MENQSRGLKVKKYIDIHDTSEVIVVTESVVFKSSDMPKYKKMFNNLVEDGVFLNKSFDDNTWVSFDEYGYVNLNFDLEIRPEINTALKCYIVLKIDGRGISIGNAKRSLTGVKHTLLNSNFYNVENKEEYRKSILSWCDTEKQDLYFTVEFINFYNFNNAVDYLDVISKVQIPRSKYRLLPNYRSILLFDVFLSDYLENTSFQEREKYYPLLLWWRITKVIPMRPIEFSILKANCCYYDEKRKAYYLKIERRKQKNGFIKFKKIPPINELKVTEEVYNLIQEYKEVIKSQVVSEFLIPYESYKRCIDEREASIINENNLAQENKKVTPYHLRYLLGKFYNEVVASKLKFKVVEKEITTEDIESMEIQRIQLGDTRHLALCGMMLQGFNPLTMAQLAGHSTFREQVSYYSHMDSYIDANTYLLSRGIVNTLEQKYVDTEVYTTWKESILEREKLKSDFYKLRKVKGGRCKSQKFPEECIPDECIFCRGQFIYDETLTENMLSEHIVNVDKVISSKLQCIRDISKNIIFTQDGKYDVQQQDMLKKESNLLNSYINQKTLLMAYQLRIKEA